MPTPLECMMVNIARWEGLYQNMPGDPGNWVNGVLVGTMRGVTPAVLAAHRGIPASSITPAVMKSVSLAEAAEIGLERFYKGCIDPLRWNAAADVVTDFGWGSGPGQAVKSTERDLLGLNNADFQFDAVSIKAWADMEDRSSARTMVLAFYDVRERFYDLICRNNPTLQQFRQGWHNRAKWFTPGGEWWAHWSGENMQAVIDATDGAPLDPIPRLLSKGMRGGDVAKLQAALRRAMPTLNIAIDGDFGPATDTALRAFQQGAGLVVDGWAGPKTLAALMAATAPAEPVPAGPRPAATPAATPPPAPDFWSRVGDFLRRTF